MRTKADFKALRESLGISQQLLADLLGINEKSVRRWEKRHDQGFYNPPQEAWDLLDDFRKKQLWVVESALQKVEEIEKNANQSPRLVNLTYWQNEREYEKAHPTEGRYYQMANANSRIAAAVLEMRGYSVSFDFPGLEKVLNG